MDLADVPRHRPMAFDKMESLIKEMQDPDTGVPVRSQKLFLTYIPAAFMGYDLVEWLMERFNLDETSNVEAINLANLLCQYGYFFPVNDSKNLVLKDDSSLYRFQSPYYWPWQAPRVAGGSSAPTLGPDNVEYAIYLVKRTLRNKQRHGLEDYELEALANLKKNLAAKWDFITMQAEEQVRLAKDRKKGDKIVSDSQERAYWRVARPPPGMPSALEPCPVPVRTKNLKPKKRTAEQITREIEYLKASLDRTRVKTSIALEALLAFSETFAPYDPWLTPPQPSNPWVSDDTLFWQINSPLVEVPSEKRVQRWAISIEELVADPTGLQEFTSFLRKEYSHENIRFWLAVVDLRRSSVKQIPKKLEDICEEFLKPGAPCEINIDGATAEKVAEGVRTGSRYALDHAADHIYSLLLKKDCYPRFIRSDHFQRLLAEGKNVSLKKAKFFNFGGQVKKKPVGAAGPSGSGAGLSRRRGSDRSLSGSAHELAVSAAQPPRAPDPPPHSHSQSNLADISRDPDDDTADVMPWECASRDVYGASGSGSGGGGGARRRQDSAADSGSSSSDISGVVERRRLPQQSTLDGGLRGAPPPLRRLSAVEPRHLAPLASPPHSPHSPRAPPPAPAAPTAPAPPPHPTPTISVSSAPDDGSPEEAASGAHSDDPPSVFASAEATPTHETIGELERSVCGSNVRVTVFECEADVDSSRRDDDAPPHRTLTREPSMTKETSPASCKDTYSEIGDLPESSRSTETSNVTSQPGRTEATTPKESVSSAPVSKGMAVSAAPALGAAAVRHELEAEVEDATSSTSSSAPASSSAALAAAAPADPVTSAAPATPCAPTVLPAAPAAPAPELVTHAVLPPAPRPAPLAVCEDIIDDEVDKVPLAPLHTVSDASETAAAKNIAHKDDTSPGGGGGIVRCDSTSGHSDRNRNDVCPWEDE